MQIQRKGNHEKAIADQIAAAYPKSERKTAGHTVLNLMAEMHKDGISDPRQQADILGQTSLDDARQRHDRAHAKRRL